ncbi:hypothetical protein M413DRAFT_31144 [Hebeloma cylindrosporum]|uniref:Uncharacterized protein n=1 Tax=Hebeloma cylindrosporum TaxID=76867 RepID=A0A0C3BKI2_HEBCY|nr:hypothetical protein M413DRAFT_31144 [Hebeloma cylindrosporum h7]
MACYAASTIPPINYGSYASPRQYYPTPARGPVYSSTYSAPPKTPVGPAFDERVPDYLSTVKTALRRLLNENKVRNMPVGFPFHVTAQNYDEVRLSHGPYEFKEYFSTSDTRSSRSHCATFSYALSRSGMMTWRITVPGQSTDRRELPREETLAQVQLHPMALETAPFGIEFMIRPQILLQALSTSLEVGGLVTIQIANEKTRIYCRDKHIYYSSGEILFVSTDHLGQHEIAAIYQP